MKIFKSEVKKRGGDVVGAFPNYRTLNQSNLPNITMFDSTLFKYIQDSGENISDRLNILGWIQHKFITRRKKGQLLVSPSYQTDFRNAGVQLHAYATSIDEVEADLKDQKESVLTVSFKDYIKNRDRIIKLKEKHQMPLVVIEQAYNGALTSQESFVPNEQKFNDPGYRENYAKFLRSFPKTEEEAINLLKKKYSDIDEIIPISNGINNGHNFVPWGKIVRQAKENFKTKQKIKQVTNSLEEQLCNNGIYEAHAIFIAQNITDIVSGETTGIDTKNKVYFLTDIRGNKKVVKFVDSEKEALLETFVNKHFGNHQVLKKYISSTNLDVPLEFEIGGKKQYLTIQEDVKPKVHPWFNNVELKNKEQKHQYLNYWMKALAEIHHYGTKIMDELGIYSPAETLSCMPGREKDLDRLERCKYTSDISLIIDLVEEAQSYERNFIHFDSKPLNRVGQFLVDWGNAGRGSPYIDLSAFLNDHRILLSEKEKEQFVRKYVAFRNEIIKQENQRDIIDETKAIAEYNVMELLINNAALGYHHSKPSLTPDEKKRVELIKHNVQHGTVSKGNKHYVLSNIRTIQTSQRQEYYLNEFKSLN